MAFLCLHLRDTMSHFSVVDMMISALLIICKSCWRLPVSISTERPIAPPSLFYQSWSLNLQRLSRGHMYTILSKVSLYISLKIASSAHVTILEPVGAPTNTDSSVRYSLLNDYVMIALNSLVPSERYRSSPSLKASSLTSLECMS